MAQGKADQADNTDDTEHQDNQAEPQDNQDSGEQEYQASPQRRVAEAITLGLSLLIVGGLALYLALQSRVPTSEFADVRAQVLWSQAQRRGERTIVPIEAENRGLAALRELHLRVTFVEDGEDREHDIAFDYVAGSSKQRAYVMFKRGVEALKREAKLEAEPSFYIVE